MKDLYFQHDMYTLSKTSTKKKSKTGKIQILKPNIVVVRWRDVKKMCLLWFNLDPAYRKLMHTQENQIRKPSPPDPYLLGKEKDEVEFQEEKFNS